MVKCTHKARVTDPQVILFFLYLSYLLPPFKFSSLCFSSPSFTPPPHVLFISILLFLLISLHLLSFQIIRLLPVPPFLLNLFLLSLLPPFPHAASTPWKQAKPKSSLSCQRNRRLESSRKKKQQWRNVASQKIKTFKIIIRISKCKEKQNKIKNPRRRSCRSFFSFFFEEAFRVSPESRLITDLVKLGSSTASFARSRCQGAKVFVDNVFWFFS